MAFNAAYLVQISAGVTSNDQVPANYKYNGDSAGDLVSTIIADDYFVDAYQKLAPGSTIEFMATDNYLGTCLVISSSSTSVHVRNITNENAAAGYIVAVGQGDSQADAGGTNTFSFPGVVESDQLSVQIRSSGQSPVVIVDAIPQANNVLVTYSGDPSTDHVLSFILVRSNT